MALSGIRTVNLGVPNRGAVQHMYSTSHQRLCRHEACASWSISRKRKNSDNCFEYFPFEKFF